MFGFLRPSDWMLSGRGFFWCGAGYARAMICVLGLPMGDCKWRELGQVLEGNVDRAGWWE
jgi:hypothetical protein